MEAQNLGRISAIEPQPYVATVAGALAFTYVFAFARRLGVIEIGSLYSFAGNVAGVTRTRYLVQMNGVIWTGGRGETFFPGSAPGNITSGGQYD
jgi:hypothetical protein